MSNEIASYKAIVRAVIKKITGNYNEDLEQEAYLKIWQNKENYQEQGKKSAWLGMLTANICRDYLKSRFNKNNAQTLQGEIIEKVSVTPKFDEKIDKKKRQKIILKAVDELPADLRKVIILYEFEEKSYKEIADKLKIAEGTVKSRLFNAHKILAQKLSFLKEKNND